MHPEEEHSKRRNVRSSLSDEVVAESQDLNKQTRSVKSLLPSHRSPSLNVAWTGTIAVAPEVSFLEEDVPSETAFSALSTRHTEAPEHPLPFDASDPHMDT